MNNDINTQIKIPNISYHRLYNLGFKYSFEYECYVYIFPLFFYYKRPTIFCRLRLYKLDNIIEYDIINQNQDLEAFYYDREYGNADDYIRHIDSKINKKLQVMGFIKKN